MTNSAMKKSEYLAADDKISQADASMSVLTGATGLSWGNDTVVAGSSAYPGSEKK